MTDPSVLVMILNYNSADDTEECMVSLLNQSYSNYSILLMDNGSMDFDKLSKYKDHPQVEIIAFDDNYGFAKAHNLGFEQVFKHTEYDFVALINNDAVAEKHWLQNMIHTANKQNADVLSCCILQYVNRDLLDNVGHKMINTGEVVPIGFDEPKLNYQKSFQVMAPCGAAMLIKSSCILELGFFDPYFGTGYEDAELGLRYVVSNKKLIYCPSAVVYHKISRSVSRIDNLDYRIQQQTNIYYSFFKLMPSGAILVNLPFIILKYILVLLVELLTFKWSYISIHMKSLKRLIKDWEKVRSARRGFFSKGEKLSSYNLLSRQQFFFFFDFQRLLKFVFGKKSTVFDRSLSNN